MNSTDTPNMSTIKTKKVAVDLKAIGRRIREIRGVNLSQTEFGRLMGIGQTQCGKYERGESEPTVELLLRLKAYSGRSVDWLLTGEQ